MGVDCSIVLPPAARVDDVAAVMGALAGLPMQKRFFNSAEGWSAGHDFNDKCVRVENSSIPSCAMIFLGLPDGSPLVDGENQHQCMYHFEGGRNGERLILPPSTNFWIAVGRGLVDFFGGTLDYNDCDNVDVDYQKPARKDIHAENDAEWYHLQERKLAVKAITLKQLEAARKVAAYK